jgi:hypothetical protein
VIPKEITGLFNRQEASLPHYRSQVLVCCYRKLGTQLNSLRIVPGWIAPLTRTKTGKILKIIGGNAPKIRGRNGILTGVDFIVSPYPQGDKKPAKGQEKSSPLLPAGNSEII